MHVRLSDKAEADLEQIHSYIAERNKAAADRIVDTLLATAYQLESFPLLGRPGREPDTRELSVPRTPYFIVYTLPDEYHLDIEAFIHERQQFPPAG